MALRMELQHQAGMRATVHNGTAWVCPDCGGLDVLGGSPGQTNHAADCEGLRRAAAIDEALSHFTVIAIKTKNRTLRVKKGKRNGR